MAIFHYTGIPHSVLLTWSALGCLSENSFEEEASMKRAKRRIDS